jgi:hypothetical protein
MRCLYKNCADCNAEFRFDSNPDEALCSDCRRIREASLSGNADNAQRARRNRERRLLRRAPLLPPYRTVDPAWQYARLLSPGELFPDAGQESE